LYYFIFIFIFSMKTVHINILHQRGKKLNILSVNKGSCLQTDMIS
jgi:hypothetical protein